MSVGFEFLAKDPEVSRLRMLVEYLREVSEEFVFVLDDRTDPRTIDAIATWPGSVVIPFTWIDDFSAARNAGLDRIHSDWTAYFDPDEIPNPKLLDFIKRTSTNENPPPQPVGYLFDTHNFYGGRDLSPHLESDWHLRMWKTGHGKFYRAVHELVALDGMPEDRTRGSYATKAPADAYIIHAKPERVINDDSALYQRIWETKV